jgi:hypothetical protein
MLGTHASFPGIPTVRWSLSDDTLDRGVQRSTPIAFSVQGLTNGLFFFLLVCLGYIYMESKDWAHLTMKLAPVDP